MKDLNEAQCRAYGNGALDGYNTGVENNPYDQDDLRHAYRLGYDYGVAMYCQDNETETHFLVINLDGEIIGRFSDENQAHDYADHYGKVYGRFAYVETGE